MEYAAPVWVVLLTLAMGSGAGWLVYWYLHHFSVRQKGRSFEQWIEDGRQRCIRVIDTDAAAAGAKRELFEWIGEIPADFNPTMFLAMDLGAGIHRAVLHEAEQKGLVQPGTFERVYNVPVAAITQAAPPASWPRSQPPTSGIVMHQQGDVGRLAVARHDPAARVTPTDVHELGAWLDRPISA